ncbi:hypothetical protein DMH26_18505 [Streptomyces sp. WAC 05379]|uniref:hypothetical protein n=1 Tax=Streptomyces sp. WAC 05379 TaxID=2203207 RepID=UPI000F737DBF|nr:hypothetical protein [Streptomyces sp. WAC 05379]RSN98494.1 hypothetical protein DMH26_18505 [Streptomyces sp. WAC 05379]
MNSVKADTASESPPQHDLGERVADLHSRLHLSDVRVQRLRAESLEEPPFDVHSIQIHSSPCEVLLEPPRFAVRVNQTVTLRDPDERTLAEVEVILIVDYTLDEGPLPSDEAVATYVEHNTYFTAHPYLRETLQNATLKLGLEPIVLGVLSRDRPRPTEVTLVRRVAARPTEATE